MPESLFGPIFSTWNVEQAVLSTLRIWLNEYASELERKWALPSKAIPRPPAPESYHGGIDFTTWRQDITPEIITIVKPLGSPELHASAGYTQGYSLQVGCLWVGSGAEIAENAEDEARAVASYLGAASMLLVQQPTLGGIAERLVMTKSPEVTLPDPDTRRIALAVTDFEVWVPTIIEENAGPVQPLPSESPEFVEKEAPYKPEPEITKVEEKIIAELPKFKKEH